VEPQARADALQGEIAAHKAEIRRRRDRLARAKAALVELEKECTSRGIRLVLVKTTGEGSESPWPNPSSNSTP
jgi:hypothetical protein